MPAPMTTRSTAVVTTSAPVREKASWLWQQHINDHPDELDIAQRQAIADNGNCRAGSGPEPLPAADRCPDSDDQNSSGEAGCRKLSPAHQEMQHRIIVHA